MVRSVSRRVPAEATAQVCTCGQTRGPQSVRNSTVAAPVGHREGQRGDTRPGRGTGDEAERGATADGWGGTACAGDRGRTVAAELGCGRAPFAEVGQTGGGRPTGLWVIWGKVLAGPELTRRRQTHFLRFIGLPACRELVETRRGPVPGLRPEHRTGRVEGTGRRSPATEPSSRALWWCPPKGSLGSDRSNWWAEMPGAALGRTGWGSEGGAVGSLGSRQARREAMQTDVG